MENEITEKAQYRYKFSVIVPIYNTEEYLEETLQSVIKQSIGFKDNIQLILVNNATEDNSKQICMKYKEQFLENVVYVELEKNIGVSGARNEGKKYIKGKYVNFLDSDDRWELTAFSKIYDFFEQRYTEIDLVACRIKHFDATDAWHGLDFKFKETKIVSIVEDYNYIQLSVCSTIIKSECLQEHEFDVRVKHAEDAKFVSEIILHKLCYGILREAHFLYRTRSNGSSVLQSTSTSLSWYFETPEYVFKYLMEYSREKIGYNLLYIQYLIMYEIQWRLKTPLPIEFSTNEKETYVNSLRYLLQQIQDFIIVEQRNLWREFKLFALSLKYGRDIMDELYYKDGSICFKNITIYPFNHTGVEIACIEIEKESLHIEGTFSMCLRNKDYTLELRDTNGKVLALELFDLDSSMIRRSLDIVIHKIKGFKISVPIAGEEQLNFILKYKGGECPLRCGFKFICKLTNKTQNSFYREGKYIITSRNGGVEVEPYATFKLMKKEIMLLIELSKKKHFRIILWRILIHITKMVKSHKQIWMIMDSFTKAGDNGEYFFKYVNSLKNNNIKTYFVIDKKSGDFERIKSYGNIIGADTKLYRLMFAISDKVISSYSFYNNLNTFYYKTEFLQDLFMFKFIYLQHGVIKDNHADTQSKYKKNFDMFVTSSEKEKRSIVDGIGGNYCYSDDVVKVTGLARFDALSEIKRVPIKRILIAPTWRKMNVGAWNEKKQTYKYSKEFKKGDFYLFYQRLINDERLKECFRKYNYHAVLKLHPRTKQQECDFVENEFFKIETEELSYTDEIKKTSLLLTDYSSIAFDFAYANIPVIYTQFDKKSFYQNHAYTRGYFDFESDGFGPVCYDYEATIHMIIKSVEADCQLDKTYQKRRKDFFKYFDGNNCKRIYEEIIRIK